MKAANWLTHLQYDRESPVWRHWIDFLSGHFDFVRYDERGCGMSDRHVDDVSDANWLVDLECIIDAADIRAPMILLGISQGAATVIRYAVKHPQRVSRMVLYGGYALGWAHRGGAQADHYRAVSEMMRLGWGRDNPVFREAFAGRFIPRANHAQSDWFNALCRRTVAPEMAVRLLHARAHAKLGELLHQVRVPTLVLHARDDEVVPFAEGRRLASEIPGADFVELDSCNHILLADEPAWDEFRRTVREFTGVDSDAALHDRLAPLTRREREVLALLGTGRSNAEIGRHLFVSEKTVRNHLSSVYRKLGVSSRTQALVAAATLAPERG